MSYLRRASFVMFAAMWGAGVAFAADTLLTGATVLDGAGGRIDNGDVLIRAGRILAVGPHERVLPAGAQVPRETALVVDAHGRWITPGLIDIHTHDGTYLLPQTAAELAVSDVLEDSDPNVADTWIEHAVRPGDPAFSRALASGVTTLQILPGSSALFGGRSVIVKPIPAVTLDQMRFPGAPQGLKMACGANPASSFGGRGRFRTAVRARSPAFARRFSRRSIIVKSGMSISTSKTRHRRFNEHRVRRITENQERRIAI